MSKQPAIYCQNQTFWEVTSTLDKLTRNDSKNYSLDIIIKLPSFVRNG